jgi:hypothetical protein
MPSQQQRSLLRLILLPSAFSSSFRSASFLSSDARQCAHRQWASIALGDQWKDVSSVLVCGDGDLSYSAWLAQQLSSDVALTATVLEAQDAHNNGAFMQWDTTTHQCITYVSTLLTDSFPRYKIVYKNSQQNADRITSFPRHEVCFGIDATRLSSYFEETFDRIIFNFPHWRGKANNKRNR